MAGTLRLDAGDLVVGDLNALDIKSNSAGMLQVWGRPGAATTGGIDTGADFVANTMDFSNITGFAYLGFPLTDFRIGTQFGQPTEALFGGGVVIPPQPAFATIGTPVSAAALLGPTGNLLDLQPLGPPPLDTNSQTPTTPPPLMKIEILEQVNDVAISERPLREDEVSAFLDCDPDDAKCQAKALGAARADSKTAEELRAKYDGLFGGPPAVSAEPPKATTAAPAAAPNPSQEKLQRAVDAYRAQFGAEPGGLALRQFVEGSPDHADALAVLNDLAATFTLAREVGMTSTGLGGIKKTTLRKVIPTGMTLDELERAVEAGGVQGDPARNAKAIWGPPTAARAEAVTGG